MSSIGALPAGAVNPTDGSLNTNAKPVSDFPSATPAVPLVEYDDVTDLAKDTPTEVISYTVPAGKKLVLTRVTFGGDNIAFYTLKIDGITKDRFETYFGGPFGSSFEFDDLDDGWPLPPGTVISVEVEHFRPDPGMFHSRVQGVLIG